MIAPVSLLPTKQLSQYRKFTNTLKYLELRRLGRSLRNLRVTHVSATAYGGGVAELMKSMIPLLNDVGLKADWLVLLPDQRLFQATKAIFNALQGKPAPLSQRDQEYYLNYGRRLAADLNSLETDLIVIHDQQPLSAVPWLTGKHPIIGRMHVDLSSPETETMAMIQPFLESCQAAVFSLESFVPPNFAKGNARIIAPAIDPLSEKNRRMSEKEARAIATELGIDPGRPLITQVSRFDRWKDPVGVIEAYRLVKKEHPMVQLVLAGSKATDDPEAVMVWEEVVQAAGGDPDILLFTNETNPPVHDREINALQTISDVMVQKSLKEGFGLTVSEALWKGRPLVAGNCDGICLQVQHGKNGLLVDSVEACAQEISRLLKDPKLAATLGKAGQRSVRERFLVTRLLADHLKLYKELTR